MTYKLQPLMEDIFPQGAGYTMQTNDIIYTQLQFFNSGTQILILSSP